MKVTEFKNFKRIIAAGLIPLMVGTPHAKGLSLDDKGTEKSWNKSDIISTQEVVENIPEYYKEQIVNQGYNEYTPLNLIEQISIDVISDEDLSWLSKCNLQNLKLNFLEYPNFDAMQIGTLPNLETLEISFINFIFYDNKKDWENDSKQRKRTFSKMCYSYESDQVNVHGFVNDIELTNDMAVLIQNAPNLRNLIVVDFRFTENTDLSWIANCNNLRSLTLMPYYDGYWDLKSKLLFLLGELSTLENLYIRTNCAVITDKDFEFMRDILSIYPIHKIDFLGSNGFHFKSVDGYRSLKPSSTYKLDFEQLDFIEKLDYRNELYTAGVYIDDDQLKYLSEKGIDVDFGKETNKHNFKRMNKELNRILKLLNIPEYASEEEKLNIILKYIFKEYFYTLKKIKLDLNSDYRDFYKYGLMYGAFDRKGVVCGNFASLLNALLERVGIETYYISNEGHAWSMIKIEGKYYYIDPTDLDAIYDYANSLGIMSEEAMMKRVRRSSSYLADPVTTELSSDKRHSNATIPFWFDEFKDIVDEYSTECSSKKYFIKR